MLLRDVLEYAWAVINNWAGYTTGGIIVAVLWLWSTMKQKSLSRRWAVALTVLFIWMATFNAWRDEKQAAVASQDNVKALQKRSQETSPNLLGHIDQILIAEQTKATDEYGIASGRGVIIFALFSIANTGGSPSIAEQFLLKITKGQRNLVNEVVPTLIQHVSLLHDEKRKRVATFTTDNDLGMILKSQPIQQGAKPRGWIEFFIPKFELSEVVGATMDVSFRDVKSNVYHATYVIPTAPSEILNYSPGTGPYPFPAKR